MYRTKSGWVRLGHRAVRNGIGCPGEGVTGESRPRDFVAQQAVAPRGRARVYFGLFCFLGTAGGEVGARGAGPARATRPCLSGQQVAGALAQALALGAPV